MDIEQQTKVQDKQDEKLQKLIEQNRVVPDVCGRDTYIVGLPVWYHVEVDEVS